MANADASGVKAIRDAVVNSNAVAGQILKDTDAARTKLDVQLAQVGDADIADAIDSAINLWVGEVMERAFWVGFKAGRRPELLFGLDGDGLGIDPERGGLAIG